MTKATKKNVAVDTKASDLQAQINASVEQAIVNLVPTLLEALKPEVQQVQEPVKQAKPAKGRSSKVEKISPSKSGLKAASDEIYHEMHVSKKGNICPKIIDGNFIVYLNENIIDYILENGEALKAMGAKASLHNGR